MIPHRKHYVWLVSNGCVLGYNLDHLNEKIDQFNASEYLREKCDFWEWLSWEEGEEVYGYSPFWNDGNPAMSRVHTIGGKHHRQEVEQDKTICGSTGLPCSDCAPCCENRKTGGKHHV